MTNESGKVDKVHQLRPIVVSLAFLVASMSVACDQGVHSPETQSVVNFPTQTVDTTAGPGEDATTPEPDVQTGADAGATSDVITQPDQGPEAGPVEDAGPPPTPDVATTPDAPAEPDTTPGPDTTPDTPPTGPTAPATMNVGFIGSACQSDADCTYDGGVCLTEAQGFPGGMCSKQCDKFCPDQDGMVTTFCVDPGDLDAGPVAIAGACGMQCMFGPSPTGCRDGYRCQAMQRFSEPGTQRYTCVPGDPQDLEAFAISACHEELIAEGIDFRPGFNAQASPDGHPNLVCDVIDPVYVPGHQHGVNYRYSTIDGAVKDLYTRCELALSLSKTAKILAAQEVSDVLHWGIYNCRIIGGSNPPKLSEHGNANAIDIRGIVKGGETLTVLGDWEQFVAMPQTDGGAFLKWFVETVFEQYLYTIILTPDYNEAHEDHFHMDLTPGASSLK